MKLNSTCHSLELYSSLYPIFDLKLCLTKTHVLIGNLIVVTNLRSLKGMVSIDKFDCKLCLPLPLVMNKLSTVNHLFLSLSLIFFNWQVLYLIILTIILVFIIILLCIGKKTNMKRPVMFSSNFPLKVTLKLTLSIHL